MQLTLKNGMWLEQFLCIKVANVISLETTDQYQFTSHSKIMERISYDQLYSYLTKFELISDSQFGYRKFHSTASALLDCTNEWYVNLDRKMFSLVVLIDLKKPLILLITKFC